jgi:two-component sensor histidine kinase
MQSKSSLWFWRAIWGSVFLIGPGLYVLYAWLPADGGTGDMESFRADGFHVQWILEERQNGLQVGDIIVRGGGYTFEQWLAGAPRGAEWRTGGVVTYEILRDGQPMTLNIRLEPVPFRAILHHWGLQLLVALAFFAIGTFVFWKRPREPAARVLMLFCIAITLQYWGDAHNFQYTILPWRWPFVIQVVYELLMYGLGLAAIAHLLLVFPITHPLIEWFPRLVPVALYAFHPIVVFGSMAFAADWSAAMIIGSGVSWVAAILYIGFCIGVGIRSIRVADAPVARAQITWTLWCAAVGCAILVPGYILPLMLTSKPLIPHPVTMLIIALIPFTLAIAILRFRLFDIEVIINRTLVYGTVTALLASLYFLIVWVFTLLIEVLWQGRNSILAVFVAALSISLAFDPLRRRVQYLINRAFYRARTDYERLLPEMSERLATSIMLDELVALLTSEIPRRLQIRWAALLVLNREGTCFVLTGDKVEHPTLPADHPLVTYLRRSGTPVLRLQPPADLPDEAQALLDQHPIELSIPLAVGERLLGLYDLGAKLSGHAYSRDEVQLLRLLGRQAAVAVENSRLFHATERQADELAGLHEAAVAISSSLEVDQVLCALAEQLARILDVSSVYICDLDEETSRPAVLATWSNPTADVPRTDPGTPHDLGRHPTILGRLQAKEPVSLQVTDPDLDATIRADAERLGGHSILFVPLVLRDRVIGYAELWETRQQREFSAAEIRLCQTLATDAAEAIEHARLFQAEREQRQLTQALREAADVVSRTLDLDQVLDHILEQVERVVEGEAFNIMLVEGNYARVVRWRGYESFGADEPIATLYMPIDWYPTLSRMVETGRPVSIPDTANEPDWVSRKGWEWQRSYVSAPIMVAGQTIGFLNVDRTRPTEFGQADADKLEALARHAATALENARLYAETQRQLKEQMALREAGAIISSTLDPATVLSRIAEAMGRAIDATSAYISSFEPDARLTRVLAEYISPEACAEERISDVGEAYIEEEGSRWLELMATGQHDVSYVDDPGLSPVEREHMLQYGAKTILYIPLLLKGHFVGSAELWESRQRRDFTDAEIALCHDIARQAAIALEHARLYEQAQLEIAERARAEERLKASLAEKEVLLKEIHHRVKNNLQVISSLLYLQSKRTQDQPMLAMFQDSQHRVRSMALVHEHLYQAKDLSRVDAAEYIRTLAGYLFRSYQVRSGQIQMMVSIKDVPLEIDAAVPCGLIVNELVSNSLKHAFPGGREGKISIELSQNDSANYVLVVADDGVGFPDSADLRHTDSLGLKLVDALVNQLEGTVKLDVSHGTRFEIVFPVSGRHEVEAA